MTREKLLEDAERQAQALRKQGYRDAHVVPEYCIASMGIDGFWTYTISVYAGTKT